MKNSPTLTITDLVFLFQLTQKAIGVLLFFDVSNRESWNHAKEWIFTFPESSPLQLVATKSDLIGNVPFNSLVQKWEILEFCRKQNRPCVWTSSTLGKNIEESFYSLLWNFRGPSVSAPPSGYACCVS